MNTKAMVRNNALDLIKIIALVTMVFDHLRFVFPSFQVQLMTVGRWAFPFFAIAIAYNTFTAIDRNKDETLKKYLVNLGAFSLISEIPYRLMTNNTQTTFNVMPTLLLGFIYIVLIGKIKATWLKVVITLTFPVLLLPIENKLEYGLFGVLLIGSIYGIAANKNKSIQILFFIVSVCLALAANLQYYYPIIKVLGLFSVYTTPLIISITLAMIFGFVAMTRNIITMDIPKVGKWAYWFYPVHMLIIFFILKI
ncbi:MAG: TraX family protein [Sedimentibacter sp.]